MDDQLHITLSVTAFSVVLSAISMALAAGIYRKPNIDDAGKDNKMKYYERTSRISAAGNLVASLTVTVYCVWVVFEPTHSQLWFITFRGIPTVAWFISKASLVWFYNGLLYFTFKRGLIQTSHFSFITANIIIVVSAVICVVCGYSGVWYGIPWLMSVGFEGFSFMYLCCSSYLCFGFVRKMLLLYVYEQQAEIASYQQQKSEEAQNSMVPDQTSFFLHVATKKTIFMTCISISACCVAASRLIYEYAVPQTHVTLMLPMIMFSLDAIITSCCIYMFSKFGDPLYHKWCHLLNVCCKDVMHNCGKKYLEEHIADAVEADNAQTVTIEVGNAAAAGKASTKNASTAEDGNDVNIDNGENAKTERSENVAMDEVGQPQQIR